MNPKTWAVVWTAFAIINAAFAVDNIMNGAALRAGVDVLLVVLAAMLAMSAYHRHAGEDMALGPDEL